MPVSRRKGGRGKVPATKTGKLGEQSIGPLVGFRAGKQIVSPDPLEWILGFQELRIGLQGAVQIETADVQNLVDLLLDWGIVVQVLNDVFGVHQRDDAVQAEPRPDLVVHEERLGHGSRSASPVVSIRM